MEKDLGLVSFSGSLDAEAKPNQTKPTDTQGYLYRTLIDLDEGWNRMKPHGIKALNRRFGRRATTTGLQYMVEEVRDGLVATNPFSLLWTVTEGLAEETVT